jgi:hypothetical protein
MLAESLDRVDRGARLRSLADGAGRFESKEGLTDE